jgi:2-polyprenyl-3-methyl-5-hydroxy-6-metoxy-1,4-benzoquinol methylase
MTLRRLLVLGSDAAYFEDTVIALRSFARHNPGWPALVMDVGLTPTQVQVLQPLARVEKYPREPYRGRGRYVPSAKARCLALARLPADEVLMLYLDGDTITLGSVEPLIEQFVASGRPLGLAAEDDPRFYVATAGQAWEGGRVPVEFSRSILWSERPMLNTGVLLAVGRAAAAVGTRALALYERLKDRFQYAEQTLINAVVYEDDVGLFRVPLPYHCFVFEEHLQKSGRPYIDPVLLDGVPVVIRHFCHKSKIDLDALKPQLLRHYGSEAAPTTPTLAENPPSIVEGSLSGPGVATAITAEPPRNGLAAGQSPPRGERSRHAANPLHLPLPVDYHELPRNDVLDLVARQGLRARRVLELGCATGVASRRLKEALAAEHYVALERDPKAAAAARAHLDEVHVADIEAALPDGLGEGDQAFDLLVALDVLEHLYDPWEVLVQLVGRLRPGGHVLVSIPNVQHLSILADLAQGRWTYQSCGLLDATHVRFFTWENITSLLEGAGLGVIAKHAVLRPPLDMNQFKENGNVIRQGKLTLTDLSREEVLRLLAFQYIVLARKAG